MDSDVSFQLAVVAEADLAVRAAILLRACLGLGLSTVVGSGKLCPVGVSWQSPGMRRQFIRGIYWWRGRGGRRLRGS